MSESTNIYAKYLYYLAKIFGLAPFRLMDNRLSDESWADKLCSMINIVLCFFGILIVIIADLKMQAGHISDLAISADLFASTVKHLGIITCIVIFILQKKSIIKIVDLFLDIDRKFESFGDVSDREEVFKVRAKFIVAWSTVLITIEITSGIAYLNIIQLADFMSILHHIIVKSFGALIHHYVVVIFATVMVNVNERLKLIKTSLSNVSRLVQEERNNIEVDFEIPKIIETIEIVYDMLCDLIDRTIKLFSLPLLIIIAVYFSRFLIIGYHFYEVGRDFHETTNLKAIFVSLIASLTSVIMALNLFAIAYMCTSTQTLVSTANPAIITQHEN